MPILMSIPYVISSLAVSKDLASSGERSKEEGPELRGWNKLVVHYLDGRLLKGYGRDLQPRSQSHLLRAGLRREPEPLRETGRG
jgi:hypothetical protein